MPQHPSAEVSFQRSLQRDYILGVPLKGLCRGSVEVMSGLGIRVYGLGFPKIRGTILGVPIIRMIVFWDLHWGPLI